MTDAPVQKTLDEMRSDMVRAIEEGDRVLVEKMNALGEYDVSAFPGGQFVQFAERAAYLRGLEDAAKVADDYKERADARANVTRGVGKHDATKGHEGQSSAAVSIAAAIRALAEKERQCLKSP